MVTSATKSIRFSSLIVWRSASIPQVRSPHVRRRVEFIRATKPVAGVDAVLIPGDPERKMRAERTRNGVPLPDDTWAAIVNTAREVGVSELSIQRAVS